MRETKGSRRQSNEKVKSRPKKIKAGQEKRPKRIRKNWERVSERVTFQPSFFDCVRKVHNQFLIQNQ